jgi:putative glutamine amidotransferase
MGAGQRSAKAVITMQINGKPVIGIVMDENTSQGATAYDTGKGYFRAIEQAGGVAIGLPYSMDSLAFAEQSCAGLMSTGARIAFPEAWYVNGQASGAPHSERFAVEAALVTRFLELDRPYLGICNGMQMLSCLSGCQMSGDAASYTDRSIFHDDPQTRHDVSVVDATTLRKITGKAVLQVNSFHREAIITVSDQLVINARSTDGLIEAIERPDKAFALGVQWHPERLIDECGDARALFSAFVGACL